MGWGGSATLAPFSPTRALVRLDLPTLGRPHTVIIAVLVMFIQVILNFLSFEQFCV